MSLTMTVLGADGSYPAVGGACSGYLLQTASTTMWLDAGAGTYANLKRHVDIGAIDAIVLSHQHADHCLNILDLSVEMMVSRTDLPSVPVYAPAGVRDALKAHLGDAKQLSFHVITDRDTVSVGDLSLTFSRTSHPVETLATKVEHDGGSFVYSSDTGPEWDIASFVRQPAVVMLEAGAMRSQPGVHLTPGEAGAMARSIGAQRLILTHLRPDHDKEEIRRQGESAFGAPVELASQGARLQL